MRSESSLMYGRPWYGCEFVTGMADGAGLTDLERDREDRDRRERDR